MSNTSLETIYIQSLQYATTQLNIYTSIFLLILGLAGNLLNCLVFFQRTLRSKPCVMYFIVASIANIFSLLSALMPRALQSIFMITDQSETVAGICKLRFIILFTMRTISIWVIALASVDRYLISSMNANRRHMSNKKCAHRSILFVFVLSIFIWIEVFYCMDANLSGTPQKCYATSIPCRIYNDLCQALIMTIFPLVVMLVFGFLTIRNVKKSRRLQPITNGSMSVTVPKTRKDERSLTMMLIIQATFLTFLSFPMAAQKLYLTFTFYQTKSLIHRAVENLVFTIVLQTTIIPLCAPFYLYTITGKLFRETLFKTIQKGILFLRCQ